MIQYYAEESAELETSNTLEWCGIYRNDRWIFSPDVQLPFAERLLSSKISFIYNHLILFT